MLTVAPTQQVTPTRRRFTTAEYYRMAEVGILREGDRVELIDGEIFEMAAIGISHANCVVVTSNWLVRFLKPGIYLSVQNPIALGAASELQPDVTLVRRYRRASHPTPADIFFVIEIADSSLDHDRNRKFPRYAAAGIPEAWLVDLNGRALERHTEPRDGRYRRIAIAGPGESLPSTILPAITIPVDELFNVPEA